MTSSPPQRVYWDSCCYLAILNNEQPVAGTLLNTIQAAKEGKFQIVASTMVITEVVRPKGYPAPIPREKVEPLIRGVFENDYFRIVAHTQFIAEKGRDLCWDFGVHPRDAIHLATALYSGCAVFETIDPKIVSLAGKVPGIEIREPKFLGQLPLPGTDVPPPPTAS